METKHKFRSLFKNDQKEWTITIILPYTTRPGVFLSEMKGSENEGICTAENRKFITHIVCNYIFKNIFCSLQTLKMLPFYNLTIPATMYFKNGQNVTLYTFIHILNIFLLVILVLSFLKYHYIKTTIDVLAGGKQKI